MPAEFSLPVPKEWAGSSLPELCRAELLHEIFEAQADLSPHRVALVDESQRLTYAELDERSTRLARWLRSEGIGRGDCVAFLVPRSAWGCIAILGILKAGAAYVPLDPDYPAERVDFILQDCRIRLLLTTSTCAAVSGDLSGKACPLDRLMEELADQPAVRLTRNDTGTTPADLCYVIYTSGSTGRPKGVEIEHRSACHLVRAERRLFDVQPDDRVWQGFSLAFDASVEEVWLALASGAALVVGTAETVHAGPELSTWLTDAGVTVLSCVPTLLAMLTDDVPTVRLLIVGGEACPDDLVRRWCRSGRRMVNTYGPTEATVIATFSECTPDRPVTIGKPLPNYRAYLLDSTLRPVLIGEPGELYLGGPGLARGYVGRPDLTRERFIASPFDGEGSRLYRTGDLGRYTPEGDIEYLGRGDSQVKIRGFRVELSEIEAALVRCHGVQAAAATVYEGPTGISQLVAFVVPSSNNGATAPEQWRAELRNTLPAYMVPAIVEPVDALPTLPSGKLDRRRLPAPRFRIAESIPADGLPQNATEQALHATWSRLFAPQPVGRQDDFFLDLGGHSLLAAKMVSELRKSREFSGLSMLDIYRHPTIEQLAARFRPAAQHNGQCHAEASSAPKESAAAAFASVSAIRHALCGLAQAGSLYFILGFFSLQWLAPYVTYTWLMEEEFSIDEALLGALASLAIVYPIMLTIAVVTKWCVLGRIRAGSYPLWGVYYFRWWFVRSMVSIVPIGYLAGTPLLALFYRLLGAKIGENVYLGTDLVAAFDLLSIGSNSSIGIDSSLMGYSVERGRLHIGQIAIGRGCFVGTRAVVAHNTVMDDGARLEDLSLLPAGSNIPAGETWRGSPAQPAPAPTAARTGSSRPSWSHRFEFGLLQAGGVLAVPAFVIGAIFPGMMVMQHLNAIDDYYYYLVLSPLVALSFVVFLCLEIAAFKWLLLGRVRPGTYGLYSSFYFRKWFVDQLLELSLDVIGPLYSTIYLAAWYRLLGAKLGRRAEVSTASFISPDLLTIEEEGFIADCVSLGAARVEHNTITIAESRIGRRSFIGNSALLPAGTVIDDNCLIGCLSTPPLARNAVRPGTSWLGAPGFLLPQRHKNTSFSEETTFAPSRALRVQRAIIEFFRVILPSSGFIALTSVLLSVVILTREVASDGEVLVLFPLFYAVAGLAAAAFVIVVKWLLMGRFRPGERPLWSHFVWRNELVTALHENLSDLFFVDKLAGTPFIGWFFRLLGAKIGRRAYIETTQFTEYDLVDIGDDVALNHDCTVQTHLFEDRVMKMSRIRIEGRCSVGALSLVLYDTTMHAGSSLGELSLLMKNEILPAETAWQGIPAGPAEIR
ncbi:MAG TPA: Pls/PosA family non-ribosomal peptide synthetase [Planctomycetaceae bacterium]|nr:Pls/PosA family non-ribosomal peptide synthetase [Planctomycetaceae bacterium]